MVENIPATICDALLFLSRISVPEQDRSRARSLCAQVEDWPLLTNIAQRKFSLPLVYRNLQRLDMGATFSPVLEAMRGQVLPSTLGALRVLAAQRKFHSACVAPLGLDHVYLKGPSLAVRYYDDPGLRYARDIDILVSRADQEALVRRALSAGYTLCEANLPDDCPASDRDVQAVLTYKTAATLMTPDGLIIEVHRNIDKRLGLFEEDDVLRRRETIVDGDYTYGVMPTADLFCYICHHNTRHIWSRLHWIADLDAMIMHASFDKSAVLDRARALGLSANVEACLDLHEIAISGRASACPKAGSHGAELAAICMENLKGDLQLEYDLRKGEELIGLPFNWMVSEHVRKRARTLTRMSKILPGYGEYEAWPLPRALQWIYYVTKPLGILRRRLPYAQKRNVDL